MKNVDGEKESWEKRQSDEEKIKETPSTREHLFTCTTSNIRDWPDVPG